MKKENEESNKPNIKDEQNLEKEIETISNETYKGFILVDYPIKKFAKNPNGLKNWQKSTFQSVFDICF